MIWICRICLNSIPGEDIKSKRLVDFHSYYKPQKGICNITFFDVVSSCLPNMNLHIPIDGMPRVCGCCSNKLIELFTLKQQSFEIEKLLLQFVKYQNSFDNCVNKPIKLADVASMYSSVFKKQFTRVIVVDLLKQLHSACKQEDTTIEPSENKNSALNTEEFKSIVGNNKDAMILVVEKNGDKPGSIKNRPNKPAISSNNERKYTSTQGWFNISQEHRKSEIERVNSQINKQTSKNCQKSSNILQETFVISNQELSVHNNNSADCSINNLTKNDKALLKKKSTSYISKYLPQRIIKTRNKSSKKNIVRISSTKVSAFIKQYKIIKRKKKTTSKLATKSRTKGFINGSKTSLNKNTAIISQNGSLNNDVESNNQIEMSLNNMNRDPNTEIIFKAADDCMKNDIFRHDLDVDIENVKSTSDLNVTYQCRICNVKFLYENEYQVHLCCTTTVQCEVCNVLFENVDKWQQHNCSDHLNRQSKARNSQNMCSFIKQSDFDDQLDSHLSQSPMDVITDNYTCEICDMDFYTKTDLTDHVAASHVSITDKYTYKLKHELTSYAQQLSMTQTSTLDETSPHVHLLSSLEQDNEQKFKCNKCPLIFDSDDSLTLHLNQHLNLLRKDFYNCDKCDKQFQYAHLLRRHKNVHSPRECLVCGQSFALSHNLHAHILLHTPTSPIDSLWASTDVDPLSIVTTTPSNAIIDPLEIDTAAFPSTNGLSPVACANTNEQANFSSIQCGGTFNDKCEIDCHGDDHLIDIKFECDICYDVFPSRPAYRMHKNTNCPGDLLRVIQNGQNSIIKQDNCAQSLEPIRKRIGNTVFTKCNASTELYQCRLCSKKFISQKFIMNHFRTHKRKPTPLHHCQHCGIGFAKITILRKHVAMKHPVDCQD